MFPLRLRRGTRHPDAPPSPCFAAEERPCDTLRAHPENTARYRCAAPLLFTSCGSGVRGIPPIHWVRWWFSVCAPCLANWGGGELSRFSVLLGGWSGARRGVRAVRSDIRVPEAKRGRVPLWERGRAPPLKPAMRQTQGTRKPATVI